MHSLVYRITLVFRQPMNTKTNQLSRAQFQWRKDSALFSANGQLCTATPTAPHIVSGVHFIKDVNCESTLSAVQQAIHSGVEFCVHNESPHAINVNNHSHSHISQTAHSNDQHAYVQCMSSGSNGKPKRIRRTHVSWIKSFDVTTKHANVSNQDSYAIVGRLSHSLALYAALEAAWIGADVHALADLRPDKQLSAITKLKSSVLYATPTQLRMLCSNAPNSAQENIQLQHIFSGGGKLDEQTQALLATHFPNATVKEFYGASETSFITITGNKTPIDSVGTLYPDVQMQIMPVDTKLASTDQLNSPSQLDEGYIGEIWVKSPYLFEHYSDGCEHLTRWHNGFLCIGEMGYIDANHNLFVTGRRSRMVNIADNMVFPEQVENILNAHKAVSHCAVIPINDAKRGSVLIAIIEAVQDKQLESELLQHCREQLGALKAPREIVFTSALPMLASGKPDLQTIEKQFGRS